MHAIILNLCAYILLLFSVFTIVVLLKKQFRQWKSTSLYILSISDVLFSTFTSSILIISCRHQITSDHENVTNFILTNISIWNRETVDVNEIIKVQNFCDISILMRYGLLLFPFTNSFTSLLTLSIECNLNVLKFKKLCLQLKQAQNEKYEQTNKNEFDIEAQLNSTVELTNIKIVSVFKQNVYKLLGIFRYNTIKKSRKITTLFVMGHWIIPIFVIALLYMCHVDTNYVSGIEITNCLFHNKYHNNNKVINPEINASILNQDYTNNKDITEGESNNTEVNEIISKILHIVQSAMNDTSASPINTIVFNNSETLDTTKNIEPNSEIRIIEHNETFQHDSNIMQNALSVMCNDPFIPSIIQFYNYTIDYNNTVPLSTNLTMDSSEGKTAEENRDYKIITKINNKVHYGKSKESIIENKVIVDSTNMNAKYATNGLTNGQIYKDISKHIHNIPTKYLVKIYNNGNQLEKKKLNILKLNKNVQHNFITYDEIEQLLIEIVNYINSNQSNITQVHVTDKCFTSIQFLKFHIFVIILVLYFLPILFSSILYQHGKLNCKLILEKLHANDQISLNTINYDSNTEINDIYSNITVKSDEPSTSNINNSIIKQLKTQKKYSGEVNMINEMKNMLKIFTTIKISLLSAILLWTPSIFIFLVEIFTLLHIAEWLQILTYLAAIAFSILRNVFNLRMIKLQETNTNTVKNNSVHPTT